MKTFKEFINEDEYSSNAKQHLQNFFNAIKGTSNYKIEQQSDGSLLIICPETENNKVVKIVISTKDVLLMDA